MTITPTALAIDESIAGFPPDVQAVLEKIQTKIIAAAPGVRATTSYPRHPPSCRRGSVVRMDGTWKGASVLLPAITLAGCVISANPIVPDSGSSIDPRLLGSWDEVSRSERAVVSRASDTTYAIEYTSDNKVSRLLARLGSLGGRPVLDVWPDAPDEDVLPAAPLMLAGHVLLAIDIRPDEIRTSALDRDALVSALQAGRVRVPFERDGDRLILHGTTDQVRSVLASHIGTQRAFGEPSAWRRSRTTASASAPATVPCFESSPWREADELFHRDPHWVGGDAASSVDLGDGRILWLFGDSWVDASGQATRKGARMVSNTVAIQTGADPTRATMRFYWGRAADGSPAAFVPDDGAERHWFGNGVRVGDRLVLFLGRIRSTSGGLGFETVTWTAWMVDNPDAQPSDWRIRRLETPRNPLGVVVGFAAVLRIADMVYAFGSEDPVKSHPIYAVRWPAAQVRAGDLRSPEWWAGDGLGWVPDSSSAPRRPLFENGQSELSIHVDPAGGRFLSVQTQGFGAADIMLRAAPALTGPWSAARMMYRPAEYYRPNVMIYSAKAHPELAAAGLAVTYATNTFVFGEQLTDLLIYYPRFVRLTPCTTTTK